MKKRKFLADLEERLIEKEFIAAEVERIINDYESLIDDALADNKDEASFIESLGSIKEIVNNLVKTLSKDKRKEHLLVALSPFIAVISFFLLGFFFNAWHPGWLVFLGIPMIAIITESKNPKRFIGLYPIAYTAFYILVGTYSVFNLNLFTDLFNLGPISIGGLWHPLWAGYLYTAVLGYLFDKKPRRKLVGLISFMLVTGYILLEIINGFALWHFLLIIAFIGLSILEGTFKFIIDIRLESPKDRKITLAVLAVALSITILYLVLGFSFNLWGIMWVLFLFIPMSAIYLDQKLGKDKFELVAYTPFIATILFFLVGYYFNLFAISWLFFLLIPITGIVEDQLKVKK